MIVFKIYFIIDHLRILLYIINYPKIYKKHLDKRIIDL